MKKFSGFLLTLVFAFGLRLALAGAVSAHCPLCVVGASAGLSLSRILGIDDSITGVWIAAFLGALSLWMGNSLKKKYLPKQTELIYIGVFGLSLWSFYAFNLIDEHAGLIMGIPKLTFGILLGGIVFYLVDVANAFIKQKRGKVLFPYQPIAFSLGAMFLLSIFIFVLINYYI